ncbi:MAG: hypothetical protein R6U46_11215 [Marinilabilia sp.]
MKKSFSNKTGKKVKGGSLFILAGVLFYFGAVAGEDSGHRQERANSAAEYEQKDSAVRTIDHTTTSGWVSGAMIGFPI